MGQHSHMYDARWRKARINFLAEHPLCVLCKQAGRLTPSTVVDHVIPHKGDLSLFWDTRNWQAICATCHEAVKKAAERGGNPMRGCDVNGMPLDPNHPWNLPPRSKG
jgi:5-methylcytosine-specific restriction endonuclease McrA